MTSYLSKFKSLTPFSSLSGDGVDEVHKSENTEEIECSKIGIIRAIVQAQDPAAKDLDDLMIRRFLRARDLDVEKASAMLLKYLKWRKEFVPRGFISPDEISTDIADNKLFMQGQDKTGRPIVVVFSHRHKPTTNVDGFKRYVAFCLDKICARMENGHEKFIAIGDLKGWGYADCDIRGYIAALSVLQDCYPERLGKMLMVNVPYIFMAAWKIVYPFVDKNTKKKIIFVEDNKLQSTLLQDIDESQLPDIYGGKAKLVPIQDC